MPRFCLSASVMFRVQHSLSEGWLVSRWHLGICISQLWVRGCISQVTDVPSDQTFNKSSLSPWNTFGTAMLNFTPTQVDDGVSTWHCKGCFFASKLVALPSCPKKVTSDLKKKTQDANAEASNQWVHHASCSHLWSTVYSYSVYKSTITRRKRCSCSGMTVSHDNPTLVSHPQVIPSSYLVFEARASKSRVTSHLCNSGDVHLLFTVCGFLRSRKVWRFIVGTQMFLHKSLQVAWSR